MKEGGTDSRLRQRALGAETGREGFRILWCSCFVLGVGPFGEGGRGRFRASAKASWGRDKEGGLKIFVVFLLFAWRKAWL